MSLYDLNKNIISQLPSLGEEDIERIKNEINTFDDDNKNLHYMLLCNELHYYTILIGVHIGAAEFSSLGSAIIGFINTRGSFSISCSTTPTKPSCESMYVCTMSWPPHSSTRWTHGLRTCDTQHWHNTWSRPLYWIPSVGRRKPPSPWCGRR